MQIKSTKNQPVRNCRDLNLKDENNFRYQNYIRVNDASLSMFLHVNIKKWLNSNVRKAKKN
ncbi:2266_t:CDS:2 [Gigaspora rosea]|nr:2266_t:CDS:2 [Gigaspora rosea]